MSDRQWKLVRKAGVESDQAPFRQENSFLRRRRRLKVKCDDCAGREGVKLYWPPPSLRHSRLWRSSPASTIQLPTYRDPKVQCSATVSTGERDQLVLKSGCLSSSTGVSTLEAPPPHFPLISPDSPLSPPSSPSFILSSAHVLPAFPFSAFADQGGAESQHPS